MSVGVLVKQNEFGFNFVFTVLDHDSTRVNKIPFDLTNLFVTLYVYTQEQLPTLLFSGACSISNPPSAGICTYFVTPNNFPTLGTYNAELEITDVAPPIPSSVVRLFTQTFSIDVIPIHP